MGANPNATDKNCLNSFHIAIINNHTLILKILVESSRNYHHLNSKTIPSFRPSSVNTLEEDPTQNCTETDPLIISAVTENNTESLEFLLEIGENPNAISKAENSTPLIGLAILVYFFFKKIIL